SYAINPVNGEQVPIWIADYVLISYGTGAIMAVPAHDERDFEFAKTFGLQIRSVVLPQETHITGYNTPDAPKKALQDRVKFLQAVQAGEEPYTHEGIATNSALYDGLKTYEFKQKITADLSEQGLGKKAVNFRLRDWL